MNPTEDPSPQQDENKDHPPVPPSPTFVGEGRVRVRATEFARHLRKNQTPHECKLWARLRDRRLSGHKFRRQHPIGPYIVDFYCVEARLIVEVDGGHHAEQAEYDQARTAWLEQIGYQVIRFTNLEVDQNIDAVLDTILSACEGHLPE